MKQSYRQYVGPEMVSRELMDRILSINYELECCAYPDDGGYSTSLWPLYDVSVSSH